MFSIPTDPSQSRFTFYTFLTSFAMPSLDFFTNKRASMRKRSPQRLSVQSNGTVVNTHGQSIDTPTSIPTTPTTSSSALPSPISENVYYNARLDPKNYLEGPLSWNAATRLRQMLARPGIVVSTLDIYSTRQIYLV